MIYQPREDSFLIRDVIKHYAKGIVLDMGTGSGILAKEAAKFAQKVIAVDINQEAIDYCKKNICDDKIQFLQSNLFSIFLTDSNLKNSNLKFDLITFNVPYLPNHPKLKDVALDGGKKGYELTEKFLQQSGNFLNPDGKILLLISSFTKKKKVEQLIKENNFSFEIISSKKIDFEELYVYLLSKKMIDKLTNKSIVGLADKTLFARGKRGVVFTAFLGKKKVAIKEKRITSKANGTVEKEAMWLKELNKFDIGPKFISLENNSIIYEFVEGEYLPDFLEHASKKQVLDVLIQVLNQCYKLDELKINKLEMTRPLKHVIITKQKKENITKQKNKLKAVSKLKAVMIDFERCKRSETPKNVTQFCQFLTSEPTNNILKNYKVHITKEEVIGLGQAYKEQFNKTAFLAILDKLK